MELEFPRSFYEFTAARAVSDVNALWFPDRTIKAGIKFVPGAEESGFPRHFGRDMCIFAWQTMHIYPDSCRAILEFLFKHQGREHNLLTEEEPGKILHEHELDRRHPTNWPDTVYYALDSTPLTLIILGLYFEQTGDVEFVKQYWPNVLMALHWIDEYGDLDNDGFVEYQRTNEQGLINQAWKDSHESYSHRDGVPAITPIAPVEVQGWVYLAKQKVATLAEVVMDDQDLALSLFAEAGILSIRFNQNFWMPRRKFLAMGLDAQKRQIQTITTNAGQALLSGIVNESNARHVVERLMKHDVLTPWGLRTLSTHERSYNPNSYHNGSIWPSDNWMCAMGFAKYGFDDEAKKIRNAILRATSDLGHNPELFVVKERGHILALHRYVRLVADEDELEETRREQSASCIIQAWSAGAVLNWLTVGPDPVLSLQDLDL